MSDARPPPEPRALRLIVGLAIRRWSEKIGQARRTRRTRRARRGDVGGARRTATPRKSPGLGALAAVGGICLFVSSLFQGHIVVRATVNSFSDRIVMHDYESSQALDRVVRSAAIAEPEIRALFAEHAPGASPAEVERWTAHYLQRGAAGFRERWESAGWPADDGPLRRMLGLLFLWIGLLALLSHLGGSARELGAGQWDLEWLWSLPVSARTIFAARLLEHATLNLWIWFTVPALGVAAFRASGSGWFAAAGMALFCACCFALVVAALHLLVEAWMRTRIRHPKNAQAVCSVLGLLLFFALFTLLRGEDLPAPVVAAGTAFRVLGDPFSLAAGLTAQAPGLALLAAAGLLLWAIALPALAIAVCDRAARSGLQEQPGTRSVARGRGAAAAPARARLPALRGVVGKDLRLLLRDRNLFVQSLVVPLVVIGFQFVAQRGLADAVTKDAGNLAALAFSISAYLLVFCAMPILSVEGQALWQLYTFPQPLDRVLAAKVRLWSGVALLYCAGTLATGVALGARAGFADAAIFALALAGLPAYAFVAAGLGAMSTDPFDRDPRRRVKPGAAYLYFLVASGLGYALARSSPWQAFVMVALAWVLAMALWQKLRDRIPFLLDPIERPPPLLSAADAIFALMAFALAQLLCVELARVLGAEPQFAVTLSFALAGAVVSAGALGLLLRRRTPGLLRLIGLERAPGDRAATLAAAAGAGTMAGAAAGACGLLWLFALARLPGLREWRDAQPVLGFEFGLVPLLVVAVAAAPLFEELLFRGLLLRGLERSFGAGRALLASAALFALVHPPASVPAVFVLGLAAGRVFQRHGVLLAPMAAHAAYNAIVILVPAAWPPLAG